MVVNFTFISLFLNKNISWKHIDFVSMSFWRMNINIFNFDFFCVIKDVLQILIFVNRYKMYQQELLDKYGKILISSVYNLTHLYCLLCIYLNEIYEFFFYRNNLRLIFIKY